MAAANNISYFLAKLYQMDKILGGNEKLIDNAKNMKESDFLR